MVESFRDAVAEQKAKTEAHALRPPANWAGRWGVFLLILMAFSPSLLLYDARFSAGLFFGDVPNRVLR